MPGQRIKSGLGFQLSSLWAERTENMFFKPILVSLVDDIVDIRPQKSDVRSSPEKEAAKGFFGKQPGKKSGWGKLKERNEHRSFGQVVVKMNANEVEWWSRGTEEEQTSTLHSLYNMEPETVAPSHECVVGSSANDDLA